MERMPETGTPEIPPDKAVWSAEDFRGYLLALSLNLKDARFRVKSSEFPRQINLSPDFHQMLDELRENTKADGHEYWTLVGVTKDRDRVMILKDPVKGSRLEVPSQVMFEKTTDAYQRGIPYLVGAAHSHAEFHPLWRLLDPLRADFLSAGDFLPLVGSCYSNSFVLLAGPERNVAVFRTRETEFLPPTQTDESFRLRWEILEMLLDSFSLDEAICQRHKLALYHGYPDQPLFRLVP